MSSRVEVKAAARQRRLEREALQRRAAERRRNLGRLAAIAVAAVAIVATAIAFTRPQDDPPPAPAASALAGIPQDGITLGSPSAPATLIEFADLQCPFCADYSRAVLPTVIDRYVRTGKLKLELQVMTFLGEDSVRAGQMAGAAAEQDRLWDFTDAFFLAQGQENSGYVTDDFLREIGTAAGLDVDRAMSRREQQDVQGAQTLADELGVQSTPSFLLRTGDGEPRPVAPEELTPEAFTAALDEALAR
jgi:protein-disulfide isomerase